MNGRSLRGALLPALRCPHCRGAFDFEEAPRPKLGAGEFGILKCRCFAYPVVDGIPIVQRAPVGMFEHTRGTVQSAGTSIERMVALVESGSTLEALFECVVAAGPPSVAAQRLLGWRRSNALSRRIAKSRFKRHVLASRDSIGAQELLEYYYLRGGPLDPAMGHYFIRRFGMPRHLAALSLASTVPSDTKPVLDVACGIGNLAHYFTNRVETTPVVGLDMNFYHLWLAKHWMAPRGHYVCANASEPLPFADEAFSSVFCSDAYHLIPNRVAFLREVERCAPRRLVVLTRVGNSSVMPSEGVEATLDGYLCEFAMPSVRTFDEDELVRRYLQRGNPFSSSPRPLADVSRSKWLSFAWHTGAQHAHQSRLDDDPPHAVGEIGWNPIYRRTTLANGDLRLTFEFPIPWYAYENHAMLEYHPTDVSVPRSRLDDLRNWRTDEHLQSLVDAFVLIGLPVRFRSAERASHDAPALASAV